MSLRRSNAERDEVLISAGELLNEGLQRGAGGQASAQPFTYTEFSDTHLNKVYFYAYDHLGNTRVTYSQDCKNWNNVEPSDEDDVNIEYAADYFPYGKVLREFVNERAEKYLTTLHQRDEETGLDYRGARYYDSDVARFLSLDPKTTEFASWSPSSYVLGNPITLVDPSGRSAECGCPDPPCDKTESGPPSKQSLGQLGTATGVTDGKPTKPSSSDRTSSEDTGGSNGRSLKDLLTLNVEESQSDVSSNFFYTVKKTQFNRTSYGHGPLNITSTNGSEVSVSYEAKLGNVRAEIDLPSGSLTAGLSTDAGTNVSIGSHPQDGLVFTSSKTIGMGTSGTSLSIRPGTGLMLTVATLAILSTGQIELLPVLAVP